MNISNFKVGDIITAYRNGYHEVTYIEELNTQIHYKTIANSKGKRVNSHKEHSCHVGYCNQALDVISNIITEHEDIVKSLRQLQFEINKVS